MRLLFRRTDEHVGHEVSPPCHFHDEAHAHAGCGVRATVHVDDIESLVAKFFDGFVAEFAPYFSGDGFVVVLIFVGGPPHGVFSHLVFDKIFVFGRTTGVHACENVHCTLFGEVAFFVAFESGIEFRFVKLIITRIVDDVLRIFDAILRQI